MIRFIIAAILAIVAIIGVSTGMHFAWAIGLAFVSLTLVAWRFVELEEKYILN